GNSLRRGAPCVRHYPPVRPGGGPRSPSALRARASLGRSTVSQSAAPHLRSRAVVRTRVNPQRERRKSLTLGAIDEGFSGSDFLSTPFVKFEHRSTLGGDSRARGWV